MTTTTPEKVLRRVLARGRGEVLTNKDFLDLGSRAAIDQALSRLVSTGALRRLGRGLYDRPKINKRLGILPHPDPNLIAEALARKVGARVVPSGAAAANRLGLATQVPAKLIYLTNGGSRTVKVGNQTLVFKHVAPKDFAAANTLSGLVLCALKYLGRSLVDEMVIARLRQLLSPDDAKRLIKDSAYTTDWLRDVALRVAKGRAHG